MDQILTPFFRIISVHDMISAWSHIKQQDAEKSSLPWKYCLKPFPNHANMVTAWSCQYTASFNKLPVLFSFWGTAELHPEFLKLQKPSCIYCILRMSSYCSLFKHYKVGKLTCTANRWDCSCHHLVEKSVNSPTLFQENIKSLDLACPSEITQDLFPALPPPGAEQALYHAITKQ